MKRETISAALTDISAVYIEEAADYQGAKRRRGAVWPRLAAACLCLAMGLGALLPRGQRDDRAVLSLAGYGAEEGYGTGGHWAWDSAELVSGNPWRAEMALTELPVYYNNLTYDEYLVPSGADAEAMRQRLLETAARFGLAAEELTVLEGPRSTNTFRSDGTRAELEVPQWLAVQTDALRLEVDQRLVVTATFTPALSLPEGICFGWHASYGDMLAAADCLLETYGALLNMEEPRADISGGEYDADGRQSYSLAFFDAGGSDEEAVLNRSLHRVQLYPGDGEEAGKLAVIRFFQPDTSWYLGRYPVIDPAEAEERLLAGCYVTSVSGAVPSGEDICGVELVYRTGDHERYYMPWYRFCVELPEERRADGMRTFGVYDVPAVAGEYLENVPTWGMVG